MQAFFSPLSHACHACPDMCIIHHDCSLPECHSAMYNYQKSMVNIDCSSGAVVSAYLHGRNEVILGCSLLGLLLLRHYHVRSWYVASVLSGRLKSISEFWSLLQAEGAAGRPFKLVQTFPGALLVQQSCVDDISAPQSPHAIMLSRSMQTMKQLHQSSCSTA